MLQPRDGAEVAWGRSFSTSGLSVFAPILSQENLEMGIFDLL